MENITNKKENKTKFILTIVGNVFFYIIIILLFLFSLMNINAGNGQENFPNLFGKGMLNVTSYSMERKDTYTPEEWSTYEIGEINQGDLVYVKVFKNDINSLKIGDVITFYDANVKGLNTHRIVYINSQNGYVVTQGDYIISKNGKSYQYDTNLVDIAKNDMLTSDPNSAQIVQAKDIKGVVTSVKPGKGAVLQTLRDKWLFFFVIPVAIVLLIEVFFVFKNILDLKAEKNQASLEDNKEAMMKELEAEKERMRQELLAELRAQEAKTSEDVVDGEVSEPVEKEE